MSEAEIDYESLAQDALRGVVKTVLSRVASEGLPGEHHFYIAFDTRAPGVSLSKRLREQYPEEMTVVLQHRFWDLYVFDNRFEVKLTFGNIPEKLVVPFAAIKVFFDPSVPYGLQFEPSEMMAEAAGVGSNITTLADRQDDTPEPGNLTEIGLTEHLMPEPPPREEIAQRDGEDDAEASEADEPDNDPEEGGPRPSADVVELDAFRKK